MSKYKFYEDHANNKVVCISTYAGRFVRGVAKCSPDDEYAYEKGAELAMSRVDVKVADKRVARAEKKLKEAMKILEEAQLYVDRMEEYLSDAHEIQDRAYDELHRIESEM